MMKPSGILRSLLFLIFLSFLYSCKKNVNGCIDAWANNNCQNCNSATNDLCEYSSDGVFWYQSSTGDSLEANGIYSLSYYIDDQFIGTSPVYHGYWPLDPIFGQPPQAQCSDDSTFRYSMTWKGNREHSFKYSVRDETGADLWSGNVVLRVKECASTELLF